MPSSYSRASSFWFSKIKDPAGILSNMGALEVEAGGKRWKSTEALYQASRFPDHPDIQELIRAEHSPMSAKMMSKPHREGKGRADWNEVRVPIMEWCLWLKLAFNFRFIYWSLKEHLGQPIVEITAKKTPRPDDLFWGTLPDKGNPDQLSGTNMLGKLWMAIRDDVFADPAIPFGDLARKYAVVPPPPVENLRLFGQEVQPTQAPVKA